MKYIQRDMRVNKRRINKRRQSSKMVIGLVNKIYTVESFTKKRGRGGRPIMVIRGRVERFLNIIKYNRII